MSKSEPIKVDIRHGSAILYTDSGDKPLSIQTLEEHSGNRAEMIAAIMADKFELEQGTVSIKGGEM